MLTIALVGRTNVGKSTLFNRILGSERVIVSELEHTTRDRTVATTGWRGVEIRMIDTGGVEELEERRTKNAERRTPQTIEDEIRTQAQLAIGETDMLVLVTDVRDGILPGERAIAHELRRIGKPVVLACNKADNARQRTAALEFAALGLGDPHPVSAKSGMGVGDLLDHIVHVAKERRTEEQRNGEPSETMRNGERKDGEQDRKNSGSPYFGSPVLRSLSSPSTMAIRIAIVGEPNVGKSSLLNAILGREEVIVRPEPFTTRDVHDVEIDVAQDVVSRRGGAASPPAQVVAAPSVDAPRTPAGDHPSTSLWAGAGSPLRLDRIVLLDTAGIRRAAFRSAKVVRKRIEQIERMAVDRSRQALARADVAVLVLDSTRPATRHVKQLAQEIADLRRACVIVVNKVDLIGDPDDERTAAAIHELFPHLSFAPVICTSALTGDGVPNVLPAAIRSAAAWRRTLDRDQLAAVYADAKQRIPTPKDREGERMLRMVELTQTDTAPPQFILHTRKRVRLPKAIPRIIEHALRAGADLEGTPVVVAVKSVK